MLPVLAMTAAIPEALTPPGTDISGGADIVGGSAAVAGQFPYQVAILHSGSLFCGGVLINANTVLTAAHCSVDYPASSVQVRAGSLVSLPCNQLERFIEFITNRKDRNMPQVVPSSVSRRLSFIQSMMRTRLIMTSPFGNWPLPSPRAPPLAMRFYRLRALTQLLVSAPQYQAGMYYCNHFPLLYPTSTGV